MENDEKIDDQVDEHEEEAQEEEALEEEEEEEEESEEMMMEKFYLLIRNYHDARNRLRLRNLPPLNEDEILEKSNNNKRKKMCQDEGPSAATGWAPSFELEDFAKEVEFRGSPSISRAPCNPSTTSTTTSTSTVSTDTISATTKQKQDDGLGSLDLKLTL